ncbi:diguanylate cyclase (GGDEF) domain-containing protein [Cohaesibacter sp. ES.047]|uniref:putative bifunctional diguanylate cyclase/phosphodiesterase n=1 Tax=Cohaesibacter sp. ES.047 TaxID=1798205 RepID=UPI000BB6CB57|nr:bifunctional diguanylate cyclase/phosphodiesterase [Cohaesibacter sp. ES.047]SNY92044.1 diguanylate cyclase (GGDEF) domain-containing protein [Cohaesibacter sp. ES.047]
MKHRYKLLVVTYLSAVALLFLLELSQFNKTDSLRMQIEESYHMTSGRDAGLRLELDYRRFRTKLTNYILNDSGLLSTAGSDYVAHEDLMTWFDIFWSRMFSINNTEFNIVKQEEPALEEELAALRQTLQRIDPILQILRPGDFKSYRAVRDELNGHDKLISTFASAVTGSRMRQADRLQNKLTHALKSMDTLLISSAIGGALLMSLIGLEALRARNEEQKTRAREARVRFLAQHDTLTGLRNRSFLNEKVADYIQTCDRDGGSFHLLLLDLDKFKDVNDTFGHPMGDRLLKKAASRIVNIFSSTEDIVSRLGGDEFAIVMYGSRDDAKSSARKAIDALSSPFEIAGHEICISTSIGISCYPQLSSSVEDLMRDADLALYSAKNKGRQTYAFFEPAMSVAIKHRMLLEGDLRRALSSETGSGLEVYYQPQVSLDDRDGTRRIVGVEALVRWFHPKRGQIPTMEFIEIAETAGLIDELSDWIIRQACQDVVLWHEAGYMIDLSVNLSPLQLNNPNLPEELLGHLDRCGFDPNYLTLEITESVDVNDTWAAAAMLSRLVDKGISLAMDDFGTGYSNLGYLKSLPLNTLKIDRSFVMLLEEKEEDRKLVRGIINLARGMGLEVVAEGVETENQVAFLREAACDIAQGYLFGRPMHKLGMLALLNEMHDSAQPEPLQLEA